MDKFTPFRFWCQKVLPLVYDNSLSYYEVLCKCADYINKLIEQDKVFSDEITTLQQDLSTIHAWVDIEFVVQQLQKYYDTTENNYRNVVLIGDSYGTNNGGGTTIEHPLPEMIQTYGGFGTSNFHASFANGAGFGNGAFYSQLQTVVSTMTEEEKATCTGVYFIGGWNDESNRVTEQQFLAGVTNCENLISTELPAAKKHVIVAANSTVNAFTNLFTTFGWYDGLIERGWDSEPNIRYCLNNFSYYVTDGSHPNQNGVYALAKYITSYIFNGSANVSERYLFNVSDMTPAEGVANNSVQVPSMFIFNTVNSLTYARLFVQNNNLKFTFSNDLKTMAMDGGVLELGSVSKKFRGLYQNCFIDANVQLYQDDGTRLDIGGNIVFLGNKIYFKKPLIYNDAMTNYRTISNVNNLVVGSGGGTFESLYF